jgi:hypothetical protein
MALIVEERIVKSKEKTGATPETLSLSGGSRPHPIA